MFKKTVPGGSIPAISYQWVSGRAPKVWDGDSFELRDGWFEFQIRLARVDCPERGQAGWLECAQYLVALVSNRQLLCKSEATDSFGREVCEVWVSWSDGFGQPRDLNVNDLMRSFVEENIGAWKNRQRAINALSYTKPDASVLDLIRRYGGTA